MLITIGGLISAMLYLMFNIAIKNGEIKRITDNSVSLERKLMKHIDELYKNHPSLEVVTEYMDGSSDIKLFDNIERNSFRFTLGIPYCQEEAERYISSHKFKTLTNENGDTVMVPVRSFTKTWVLL